MIQSHLKTLTQGSQHWHFGIDISSIIFDYYQKTR